jgi:hypothetical protein
VLEGHGQAAADAIAKHDNNTTMGAERNMVMRLFSRAVLVL